jgi:hypothetical protein
MRTFLLMLTLLAFAVALQPSDAQDKKPIKPSQTWRGKNGDNDASKLAPKNGFLTDQKAFEDLWTGWKLKDKAPTLDFEKNIVVVTLSTGGPNVPNASFTLTNGDVKVTAISTLIAGPGFGYSIDVLSRDGIKSIQGKAIDEAKK